MYAHEGRPAGSPAPPRPLARARPRGAVHGACAPPAAPRAANSRLRPARAAARADGRVAGRDGQPLPPPARARGGRPRRLRVERRQAHVRDHRARRAAPRPVGRGAPYLAGADATVSRTPRAREANMAHGHHRRGWGGGPRILFRGGFPNRLELLERLETYQRDLEQQLADIADVIAHLRDKPQDPQAAT